MIITPQKLSERAAHRWRAQYPLDFEVPALLEKLGASTCPETVLDVLRPRCADAKSWVTVTCDRCCREVDAAFVMVDSRRFCDYCLRYALETLEKHNASTDQT